MRIRTGLIVLCSLVALAAVGCSSDDSDSADTTTTTAAETPTTMGPIGGDVLPPVVLSPEKTSATVKVGTIVTFDMGDPGEGEYAAVSSDPAVFDITSAGRSKSGTTYNAAGKALAPGEATVSVSYRGSANGVGTPTSFAITVEAAG